MFLDRYKPRIPVDADADESVVSRLRHQLNKHGIKFEDILEARQRGRIRRDQDRAHSAGPFMGNQLREPIIKAIQDAAKVSWDRKLEGWVEDEYVPLPSDMKRLESFCFNRYKLRIPASEDTGETVVNRLKRQFDSTASGLEHHDDRNEEGRDRRDQKQAQRTW